jgi:deuterolysin
MIPAGRVPFLGIRKRVKTSDLAEDAFTHINAGQTIEVDVDIASVHDLSAGGKLKVASYGALPYAVHGSTILTEQALVYDSNELEFEVNGTIAAKVERAIKPLDKRTAVQGDCTGSRRTNTLAALQNCARLASAAAGAASTGNAAKFQEYFKTASSSVRGTVAARLRAVANECSSSTSGTTTQYCTDVYGACDSNTLAYTSPADSVVVNCPIYFSYLPVISSTCHAQDMATTTLHEYTHADAVFSPGTLDNAYGYSASVALSQSRAVLNADSYALYANGTYYLRLQI